MTQYPDEKSNNPYHQWVQPPVEQSQYPARQGSYAAPEAPPPAYGQPYASQDASGAPLPWQGQNQFPPQGPYPPQVPNQGYYPPQGPPQGYYPPPGPPQGPSGYPPYETAPSGSGSHPYYTQTPGAGMSQSPQDRTAAAAASGGVGMSLSSFFGDKGPPPMWQRPPRENLPYNQFPPMCLISNGKDLSKGFPELPPPCQLSPHPFASHDIAEEDWKRFLVDVKKSGSLSPAQRIKSNVLPMAVGASFLGGFLMTNAIERKMKSKNRSAAGDVVDHWNHYFFGPRRMEVVLCQSSERLSGRLGAAPIGDPHQQHMANGLRRRSSGDDSSSSSSSDSEDEHRHSSHSHKVDYKSDRRARRAARREARRARRAERRERKARGDYNEPYQLFITPI
ncbi:hypothetical protein BU15DRAFT_88360 [Melanogaster broomeanus]|nr:hypothetical protein BU15DRAFT_88360 [Melanogaster broomeanus]